mmetsp:Transcript_110681/g.220001  ORF Transcript_110681/g.220001 Transcript_110681/m.220001 type:complete len:165 (+) Transcript_110681:56-550(+)|eukprot:CAMPEP_0172816770 /NCGR_PEP_ID=MMETSP1075-20121228/12710_1 /TAXON_ID=2916 /ORGANISM="Ceratium fusus, Strain PA161109" /LENGTH=164 /DNA_ID=CAMNT_0013656831 /DNA_START=56 /DNA_END=550 /DNA_ORIENTATION=-
MEEAVEAISGWDGVGFKVVAKVGVRHLSIWAGDAAEYQLGLRTRDLARPQHGGGLYVCRSLEAAVRHRVSQRRGGLYVAPRVVLRCLCEGPFVEYIGGKIACSELVPVQELPMPRGYLHSAPRRPSRPQSPVLFTSPSPLFAARRETEALEAEVADLERILRIL